MASSNQRKPFLFSNNSSLKRNCSRSTKKVVGLLVHPRLTKIQKLGNEAFTNSSMISQPLFGVSSLKMSILISTFAPENGRAKKRNSLRQRR